MRAIAFLSLCGLFITLWGSGLTASRLAIGDLSMPSLLCARYISVVLLLLVIVSLCKQWRQISFLELLGQLSVGVLIHAIYLICFFGAYEQGASTSLIVFIVTLHPLLTASLSYRVNQERVSTRQWRGLLIASSAVVFLISDNLLQGTSWLKLSLPLMCVLALSLGTLLSRQLVLQRRYAGEKSASVMLTLLIQCVGALIVLVPFSAATGSLRFNFSTQQWVLIAWLSVAVSLGGFALLQVLIRRLPSTHVASLTYLAPAMTMAQAYLIFGDTIESIDFACLLTATLGVYFILRSRGTRHRRGYYYKKTTRQKHSRTLQSEAIKPMHQ